eukprot:m.15709 g.15709  ORF g.15709 m.15709 type:complete len:339 (+) comp26509_c0_seq3:36-1052(+)
MDRNVLGIGKQLEKLIAEQPLVELSYKVSLKRNRGPFLDYAQNEDRALDLLQALRGMKVTVDGLKKSHIGKYVNTLRKGTTNDQVKSLAKKLISAWKKQLESENSPEVARAKAKTSESMTPKGSPTVQISTTSDFQVKTENPQAEEQNSVKVKEETTSKTRIMLPAASVTGDDIRRKTREMIRKALAKGDVAELVGAAPEQIVQLSGVVEDCIFEESNCTDQGYKKRVRSLVMNLGDEKNPGLRQRVLIGEIAPKRLATMSPLEMASDDLKKLRQDFTKETIRESQMAVQGGTKTDLLKCGRCKGNNCSYNQVQTRSADEPMTTFVLCNECGHRWRFC